jgi:hypothetical protein
VGHHRDTPPHLVDDDLVDLFPFGDGHNRPGTVGATDKQTVNALLNLKLHQLAESLFVDVAALGERRGQRRDDTS